MNTDDLTDLIHIYDSIHALKSALGLSHMAFGYDEGIFGELNRIEDIIGRNSVLDPDEVVEILDREATAYERAEILLGEYAVER